MFEERETKAAVCRAFGEPLCIEDIGVGGPQAGEVRVRLVAAGICHSDLHLIKGDLGGELPLVAGHEAAGIVDTVGPGIDLVHCGDHVVVSLIRSCGRCFYCATGLPQLCEGRFPLGTQSRLHARDGGVIHQGLLTGAFAEYVVVDQSQVVSIPHDLPLDCAALLACGVITGVGAVVTIARVQAGASVAVIGAGGVGLNAIQGAVLAGATPIMALDMLETKLEAARTFGATHIINVRQDDALPLVREATGGRGADFVFVTVGSKTAVSLGLTLARRGGTIGIVGIAGMADSVPLPIYDLVVESKQIIGCLMGGTRLRVEIPRLIALYAEGRLKLDELITARYPLEHINDAIAAVEQGTVLRNVIMFGPAA